MTLQNKNPEAFTEKEILFSIAQSLESIFKSLQDINILYHREYEQSYEGYIPSGYTDYLKEK